MSIKLVKPTDALPCAHPTILIYSEMPGVGRTSIGNMTRAGLLVDSDRGAHRAMNRKDTVQVDTYSDVRELADSPMLDAYKEMTIDTVGRMLDLMAVDLIADNPKNAQGDGTLSLKGWGALRVTFVGLLDKLRKRGLDVILLAHGKADKDGDMTVIRPDIQGGTYGEVFKQADAIGFLSIRGRDRVLDFSPTERWIGKNPGQWPPIKVPNYGQDETFLSGLIDKARDVLGRISEASAKTAEEVNNWRADIAKVAKPEEATAMVPVVQSIEPMVLQAQVKRLLADHCKAAGWEYDKEAKSFKKASKKKAGTEPEAPAVAEHDPEAEAMA